MNQRRKTVSYTHLDVYKRQAEGQLDREYGSGAPYVLWVAMGMQENPDALKGPGTYNDYNLDTYPVSYTHLIQYADFPVLIYQKFRIGCPQAFQIMGP